MNLINVLALLAIAFVDTVKAQYPPVDSLTEKYTYDDVVRVDSVAADTLFRRGRDWFQEQYKMERLNVESAADRKLSHAGSFTVYFDPTDRNQRSEILVKYTATVLVKSGRYRYTFTDFVFVTAADLAQSETMESYYGRHSPIANKRFTKMKAEIQAQLDKRVNDLIQDLGRAMNGTSENDW